MRRCIAAFALLGAIVACESERTFADRSVHRCVGIGKDDADSTLRYELSSLNTVVGIVFFEVVAPPVIILTKETYCPYARKQR